MVAFVLIGLAATILIQLLLFPSSADQPALNILTETRILNTVAFSLFQAGLSTILSIVLGIMLAWSLANCPSFPFRSVLISLISSALVLPTLVVVLGIVSVYGRTGWLASWSNEWFGVRLPFSIYGLGGILLAHTFFNASFAARLLLHRFETIAIEKQKLAHSLGLGFIKKFMIVDFPAIRPAIPGLSVTVFLLCFTSFSIVLTLGGHPAYNTLEVAIYEAVKFDFDLQRAFQLAMMQVVLCLLLVLMASAKPVEIQPSAIAGNTFEFQHLVKRRIKIAQYVIIVLFTLFFVSPLAAVVLSGVGTGALDILNETTFQRAFTTSIAIATIASCLALIMSLLLSSAIVTLSLNSRIGNSQTNRLLKLAISASSMLYLVFPALVMGLGFFLLFQKTGGSPAIWAGSVVTIASALMAIPFGVAALYPAIHAAAGRNDRLCSSLGLGYWQRMYMVNWAMLKNDVTYVFALAFCLSLGDLGVIALFGSDELQTLPWLLYQKFGSYRTNDASVIALVLLIMVATMFLVAQFAANKERSS